MTTRRIGATWFDSAVSFNDFINAPHGYYSIDGGADVDMGELTATEYQSDPDPISGETVTLFQGSVNPTIPAGAEGANVVYKIYDPLHPELVLEYPAIDVITDEATTVIVSPAAASVHIGGTLEFSASFTAADGFPTDNHDTVVWTTDASGETEGGIDEDTGVFTGGTAAGGPYTVTATAGAINDNATVTVVRRNLSTKTVNLSIGLSF